MNQTNYQDIWSVVEVSLSVAMYATLAVMLSSLVLAHFFAFTRSRLVKALELLIYLPMAMPPVALGYGLLLLFGHKSWLGVFLHGLGIDVAFSFLGAVVASFTVSLGIGVRTLRIAFEEIDIHQCQIASLMGASRLEVYWYIMLPQCKRAIFGAGILVFIRALSEFGATMVLAGNSLGGTRTLALAIWVGMETPGKERECLILVMIAAVISALALIASEIMLQKKAK